MAAPNIGSGAKLVQDSSGGSCGAQQPGAEQIELCSAIHLALDQLQLGVLPFSLTVGPWLRQSGVHAGAILHQLCARAEY